MKYFLAIIIILLIILYFMGCVNVTVYDQTNVYVVEPVVELEMNSDQNQ